MKRIFYLLLVAIITYTVGISQDSTTYSLNDFSRNQVEGIIDSIWNEVVSWDGDSSQIAFLKREKYADELSIYHLKHTDGNTALNSPEGKALLYSFFIRFRNKSRKKIIQIFSQDLDDISPELWQMIYPIYSKNLKAELKENEAWIPVLDRLAETDTSDFQVIGISLDQNAESLRKFIVENDIKWPQIFEGADIKRQGKITLLYNGLTLPTYYVIDKEGIIQYNYDSRKEGKDLEVILEEVMKE